mmetsp:Transcript_5695/g.16252  ORF Transcript_5695/g.16252 Transcript_5695/m.16252 type:complete len:200 (+) Transcript_5695:152-751(+)
MGSAACLLAVAITLCSFSSAVSAAGVLEFLQGDPNLSITAKFVQLADAPSIFGDSPSVGVVLFAPTDTAWAAAADKLGISLDPATASKKDGEVLGSIMMYNMISGTGVSVKREGTPDSLNEKSDIQSILGAAYNENLFISFSSWSEDSSKTVATGLATNNNVVLGDPQQAGKSLVYLTDTVLLPDDQREDIPVPNPNKR